MADIFKFPNGGYGVNVLKKQDILNCIDENIIDKDIALEIVKQCEKDAAEFINNGVWAGLPFIGNVRVPKAKALEKTKEQQELIQEASDLLDRKNYILFRKQLNAENSRYVQKERYFNYVTSIAVNKNKKLYKKICSEKGEHFAKVFIYSCINMTPPYEDCYEQ